MTLKIFYKKYSLNFTVKFIFSTICKALNLWLFQIANNAVIDCYRQQSKQSALQQETLLFEQSETNIKAELSHCISPFLTMLNEHQAQLLTTIDING
ncbi:hypothetical protein [Thalassotalea eurytherma]|uniref:hypothetical protein n=1 Tax=Thalassotalea eurytherma TaxID=1144278 RepID=UPI0024E17FE3|nr:hypothetical protein [Thalassotalea eurytherma]